jgi:uncharacterized protein (UPF0548 family)
MFTFKKPTEADIIAYLLAQIRLPFSYPEVGLTRSKPPICYDVDRQTICLGQGEQVFQLARRAIENWEMFPREMTELYWPDKPLAEGVVVAVVFRAAFFWSLNACRIVYTIDESCGRGAGRIDRFGFAYGTLPDHLECGEERFTVEWRHQDDSVWYDLLAVSRPRHPLARLAYPMVRRQQRRFRLLSAHSMQRTVASARAVPESAEPCTQS